ncbi:MAG: hypothetical protein OEY01_16765 [Desulfobulbaceae bacterium]|nr:hypothetical protein [Desulfobulbaceae bacterium]
MKKGMKKIISGTVAAGACLSLFTGIGFAEDEKPTADITVAALNQYVWRGFAFSKDSIVVQPSMTVGYKGFSANIWGNLDTDPYSATADQPNNWTETDLTMAYETTIGKATLSGGWIYYGLDAAEDTQEFFVSASYDTILSPTLTVYRDTDNLAGWYAVVAVSHSVPLTDKLALDLGAQISYLDADEASSYGEVVGGAESSTESYSNFHDGVLSASITIPVNEYVSVTPLISYSFPLSSDASDLLKVRNESVIDKYEDNFVYGGISASLSF